MNEYISVAPANIHRATDIRFAFDASGPEGDEERTKWFSIVFPGTPISQGVFLNEKLTHKKVELAMVEFLAKRGYGIRLPGGDFSVAGQSGVTIYD